MGYQHGGDCSDSKRGCFLCNFLEMRTSKEEGEGFFLRYEHINAGESLKGDGYKQLFR